MLARGAAAEVAAGHEDRAALRLGLVEHEVRLRRAVGVVAPVGEQLLAQAFARRGRQKARRNDLVGVDVRRAAARRCASESVRIGCMRHCRQLQQFARIGDAAANGATPPRSAGSRAACARPMPWRPSKLRLLVLTEYCPSRTRSPFMPRHIEQPDSRHSAPASMKTRRGPRPRPRA